MLACALFSVVVPVLVLLGQLVVGQPLLVVVNSYLCGVVLDLCWPVWVLGRRILGRNPRGLGQAVLWFFEDDSGCTGMNCHLVL